MPPVPKPKKGKVPSKGQGPSKDRRPSRNVLIALAAAGVAAVALIAGSLLLTRGNDSSSSSTGSSTTSASQIAFLDGIAQNGRVLGDPKANVQMIQYEDLQCPICKDYTDASFQTIVDEYVRPGKVKIEFNGLAFIGPDSVKALRLALAAGKQNKLWQVVELLYKDQGAENSGWVTDSLVDQILASVAGLDAAKVKADAQSADVAKQIAAIQALANARQVQGTPSFFIGIGIDRPYSIQPTALTPDAFRPALDDALKG